MKRVILSRGNRKDTATLPEYVKNAIELVHVESIEEVITNALEDFSQRPRFGKVS